MKHEIQKADAAELILGGAEVIRIDHESMVKMATLHPRIPMQVLDKALAELDAFPEEARSAWYSIPYRKGKGSSETVMVEGPSIRAAMPLARAWGNCSVGCRVVDNKEDSVELEGRFIDYETGYLLFRPHTVSKLFKTREHGIIRLDPQRLLMAIQSGVSKAIRNVVCDGVPRAFVNRYVEHAKELVAGKNPNKVLSKKRADEVSKAFVPFGVSLELIERKLGKPAKDWTGTDRATLVSWYNALAEGQTSPEQIFGPEPVKKVEAVPDEVEPRRKTTTRRKKRKKKKTSKRKTKAVSHHLRVKAQAVSGPAPEATMAEPVDPDMSSDDDDALCPHGNPATTCDECARLFGGF